MVGTATPCDVITRLRKGDPHRMEESVERQNLLQGGSFGQAGRR